MRIGYSVEGSTDRAFLEGLRRRWCPTAELVEGTFRGTSDTSRRREIRKICAEMKTKGVDMIVFLTDSNDDDPHAWKTALRGETARIPPDAQHLAVCGACQRNVESWLCADPVWVSARFSGAAHEFQVADPKRVFESAIGITRREKREQEIAELVVDAPMHNWLANTSFEAFYDQIRRRSKQMGCDIENLRDARHS